MMRLLLLLLLLYTSPSSAEVCQNVGIELNKFEDYFTKFDLTQHDTKFLGHTLERHVAKSPDWLEGRLVGDRHKKFTSTYTDLETANRVIKTVVLENKDKIKDWLKNKPNKKRLSLSKDFKEKIGVIMFRGDKTVKDCNLAVLVLKRVSRDAKDFFIITSYPVASKTELEEHEKNISWSKYPRQEVK